MHPLVRSPRAQLPGPQHPGRQMYESGDPDRRRGVVIAGLSEAGFQFLGPRALASRAIASHGLEAVDQQPLGEPEPDLVAYARSQRLELAQGDMTERLLKSLQGLTGTFAGLVSGHIESPRCLKLFNEPKLS